MKRKLWQTAKYILVSALSVAITLAAVYFDKPNTAKLEQLSRIIQHYYIEDVEEDYLADVAAEAMVSEATDRWSYYIPADEYAAYRERVENAYVGIGITITVAHDGSGLQVMQVNEGSSAQEAGIQVDDVITAIEGQSAAGMTTTQARDLVRGKEGTQVQLTIWRAGQTLELSVTRRTVKVIVATGELIDGNVGLVTIDNFDDRCAEESIAVIESLLEQGAQKLIFDVRGNPGGFASEMVQLLDYLLPEGDLFRTVDYSGKEAVDTSDASCLELPMAVLVNGDSYSAAEFFAAALQEYEAAVVVGEKTSGKGHFQNTFPLSDGSAVALSTGRYFTPKGVCLEGVGITLDLEVPVDPGTAMEITYGRLEPMEDPQILAALQLLG